MDDTLDCYVALAGRLLRCIVDEARRGSRADRRWLLSPAGAAYMEGLDLDPDCVQAALRVEWGRQKAINRRIRHDCH